MKKLFVLLFALNVLAVIPSAHAAKPAKPAKPQQAQKERLVLMPLRVGEDIQNMLGAMETALAEGLQQRYTVFAGEDVAKKTREIFRKESAKKNCDETHCLQDIAIEFQSELIATASVTKIEGGYLLALSIRNVMDNKAVFNKSLPCENCSAFEVVDKLKEMSGVPVVAIPVVREIQDPAMVRIPGKNYEMGKYHVTKGEFAKFVSETGYDAGSTCYEWDGSNWDKRSGSNWRNPGFTQDDNHPVTCVSWNDAQAYASWLAKKTGKQYRLPIESEWEYACAGGTTTEYCGSNDINAVAWYKENSNSATHPVGQKQANGYGLYDMSGNLWQWMENKYDDKNDGRALRGGSWDHFPQFVSASVRFSYEPALRYLKLGFRLARTLP